MTRFIAWAQAFAMGVGAPGLFLLSYLDASFLSLPEVSDILVILMVTRTPSMLPLYVALATAGSVLGCLTIYFIGRKGGEALFRRRFRGGKVDRALAAFNRYGVAAVIVPSMLPPPVPLKLFVVAAGLSGMSAVKMATSIAIGRGLRYIIEGVLALYYGEAALHYLRDHGREAGLIAAAVTAALLVVYYWANRDSITREAGSRS